MAKHLRRNKVAIYWLNQWAETTEKQFADDGDHGK